MLDDLDSGSDIARLTAGLLERAEVRDRLPTPVEDIIEAAGLTEPNESVLADHVIEDAPPHLASRIKKLKYKVQALVDRRAKEVHVHPDINHDGQRRFKQLHEVTHDLLPWQDEAAYVDDSMTLSWTTKHRFEQEANQGGAELMFQRTLFETMAADYKIGFPAILDLANKFGASYHASFRRYVETHHQPMAGLVVERSPCETDPLAYRRREAVCSSAWTERYDNPGGWPRTLRPTPYCFVNDIRNVGLPFCSPAPMVYPNLNDEPTDLSVELWSNSYCVFVLLWVPRRELFKRKRIIVPAAARS
jgi:IrrE N-terminal-like domain